MDTRCFSCHSDTTREVEPDRCLVCHDTVKRQRATGLGFHAGHDAPCESCHIEHRGRDRCGTVAGPTDSTLDHSWVGFPLEGAHRGQPCEACHETPGAYQGLSSVCGSCHDNPHGVDAMKTTDKGCDTCHSTDSWAALPLPNFILDHTNPEHVRFVLDRDHRTVDCRACHEDWRFAPIPHKKCTSCHEDGRKAPKRRRR